MDLITNYFDPLRPGEFGEYFYQELLNEFQFVEKYKLFIDIPTDEFSKVLAKICGKEASVFSKDQEEKIRNELGKHSLFGKIDADIWSKCFRYWTRKDTGKVSAFVIVDVQNDFISGSLGLRHCPAKEEGEDVVPVINRIIEQCNFNSIVYTFDWHPSNHCSFASNVSLYPLDPSSKVLAKDAKIFDKVVYGGQHVHEQTLWPDHCVQGSQGAELHADLKIKDTDLKIYKGLKPELDSYSAFWDNGKLSQTKLLTMLLDRNVTDVFMCGLATDICVANTALHSLEHGFNSFLIADACKGVCEADIKNMKEKMTDAGIKIITSEQIAHYL